MVKSADERVDLLQGGPTLKTVHVKTFGCQMNVHDSQRIQELLATSHGLRSVERPEEADLVVLNTCHVREKAEEKLFSELGRIRKMHKGSSFIMAVGGCVGQAEGTHIFRRAPYVDIVFGPQNFQRLPELLDRIVQGEKHLTDSDFAVEEKFEILDSLPTATEIVAPVTVQEGCDRFCTFCVVPHTRGREFSRSVEEITKEVENHLSSGAGEILLLGQNVNAYHGLDQDGVTHDLALLIRRLITLSGVDRLRFVTSHPVDMNDDLVEVFGEFEQLCPYMHLPVQSGSDATLTAMKRGHTIDAYLTWIDRLRAARPDIAIASDFIVGFPGETEDDFQRTLELVHRVQYDHAYSFKYSPRSGTEAAALADDIPEEVKAERLSRLQEVINHYQYAHNKKRVGKVESVLVEGVDKRFKGRLTGRTPTFRSVYFDGPESWVGRRVDVMITEGKPNSLRGRTASTLNTFSPGEQFS
ncbi:MAG: tRNA (N6-isopentenyl adenosine(37)-C2)-methylthiotransferase MiaB [Magnetococcales bacterium]|nr:tRNA (N6-isopentenyl adenosine(37)-C2)-methylthiotransferase MiaB [Magnetococcales bacterium]